VRPRLRFAPSPTGYLHVGGARTALFNWLYARRHGGTFILRIEDTDAERSSTDMVTGILQSLRWLGLDWDEGPETGGPHAPYFQSERLDRYRAAARALVKSRHAYYCYCRPETLQAKREAAQAKGEGWIYDRACLNLSDVDRAALEAARTPRAVRFKVPPGKTTFNDQVHGPIEVDHASVEDFVILRSDGHPTYHLSVVVDDVDMAITHVVRGDDHISNTPKQILLYRAMAAPEPAFAHVPLILGPDKKRLSKRHGATSVGEYEKQGILPEAMINFLVLLGWSPGEAAQELFTREDLVARFTLEGISGGSPVFNPEKLQWFNQQHIMRLSAAALLARLDAELAAIGLREAAGADVARTQRAVDLTKPRARTLADLASQLRPFLAEQVDYDAAAVAKHLSGPEMPAHLDAWKSRLAALSPFDAATLERELRALAESRGIKPGVLIHATRVAITGQAVSPGVFEVLELVGRERALARIATAQTLLLKGTHRDT
jgi:glutamyl-tRNA synthetase